MSLLIITNPIFPKDCVLAVANRWGKYYDSY